MSWVSLIVYLLIWRPCQHLRYKALTELVESTLVPYLISFEQDITLKNRVYVQYIINGSTLSIETSGSKWTIAKEHLIYMNIVLVAIKNFFNKKWEISILQ
jgi:hypothetical protein